MGLVQITPVDPAAHVYRFDVNVELLKGPPLVWVRGGQLEIERSQEGRGADILRVLATRSFVREVRVARSALVAVFVPYGDDDYFMDLVHEAIVARLSG